MERGQFFDCPHGFLSSECCVLAAPRCLDFGDVDLLHGHHGVEGTLGFGATSRERLGQHARGDLPGEAPAVLAPSALTFLAAIADDRVPVAVCLFLIVSRDHERKSFAVFEHRAAVEAETRNAQHGEFNRQHIALLPVGEIGWGFVNSDHFTVGKGCGVEAGRILCVLVEPEADRIFRNQDFLLKVMGVRCERHRESCAGIRGFWLLASGF
jgi:hypothetical protein